MLKQGEPKDVDPKGCKPLIPGRDSCSGADMKTEEQAIRALVDQ
jgi:hypothetical protein